MDEDNHQPDSDPIQDNLDYVSRQLARPKFLAQLTPSRLPSQAASDTSISPPVLHQSPSHSPSQLSKIALTFEDVLETADFLGPLLQEPAADRTEPVFEKRVTDQLEAQFIGARNAFSSDMASDRNFQTFSHGHQDLVLAVDFNYFGTRMVTASSDHRLKVWDKKDDSWSLVESWKAHDAEIVDVSRMHFFTNANSLY
jgi:nucleoporin SEH1